MSALERAIVSAKPQLHYGHTKKVRLAAPAVHLLHRRFTRIGPPPPPSQIMSLAWSSTGHLVATGSGDFSVRTWSLDPTGAPRRSDALRGHAGAVDAVAWSPTAPAVLASGATDRTVRLWDTRVGAGRCTSVVGTSKSQALSLTWTPDGLGVAVGTRDDLLLFIDTRKASGGAGTGGMPAVGSAGAGAPAAPATAAAAAAAAATAAAAPTAAVVSSTQFREELNEFAFAPTGCGSHSGLLFAGLGSKTATVEEGAVGVFSLHGMGGLGSGGGDGVGAGAGAGAGAGRGVEDRGSSGSTGGGGGITELGRVSAHTAPITQLRFSPSGAYFATGSGDASVCVWDAADGGVMRVFDRPESAVWSLSWSPDGGHLAIASGDKEDEAKHLELIRVIDGTRVRVFSSPAAVHHVAWAPHACVLAYSTEDASGPGAAQHVFDGSGRVRADKQPGGAAYEAGGLRVLALGAHL